METQNGNSCKLNVCSIDVHKGSFAKFLNSRKPLEYKKIVSTNCFADSNEKDITTAKKIFNPKP